MTSDAPRKPSQPAELPAELPADFPAIPAIPAVATGLDPAHAAAADFRAVVARMIGAQAIALAQQAREARLHTLCYLLETVAIESAAGTWLDEAGAPPDEANARKALNAKSGT